MSGNTYMVLIDGTGPYDDQQYARDFEFSFLNQIAKNLGAGRSAYFPGPGTIGLTTKGKANLAVNALHEAWIKDKSRKLFVAGYSRGGAAALHVAGMAANWFPNGEPDTSRSIVVPKGETIPIEAVFLLDPVSKDLFCGNRSICENVKYVYSMYRDKTIWEYSPPINPDEFAAWTDKGLARAFNATAQNDPDRYAREFMGNAEFWKAPGNNVTQIKPRQTIAEASHGAIGGMPWVERRDDWIGVEGAKDALNVWLLAQGIGVQVKDNSYSKANMNTVKAVTEQEVMGKKFQHQREIDAIRNSAQYQQVTRRRDGY